MSLFYFFGKVIILPAALSVIWKCSLVMLNFSLKLHKYIFTSQSAFHTESQIWFLCHYIFLNWDSINSHFFLFLVEYWRQSVKCGLYLLHILRIINCLLQFLFVCGKFAPGFFLLHTSNFTRYYITEAFLLVLSHFYISHTKNVIFFNCWMTNHLFIVSQAFTFQTRF